jgi:hypothetical protein
MTGSPTGALAEAAWLAAPANAGAGGRAALQADDQRAWQSALEHAAGQAGGPSPLPAPQVGVPEPAAAQCLPPAGPRATVASPVPAVGLRARTLPLADPSAAVMARPPASPLPADLSTRAFEQVADLGVAAIGRAAGAPAPVQQRPMGPDPSAWPLPAQAATGPSGVTEPSPGLQQPAARQPVAFPQPALPRHAPPDAPRHPAAAGHPGGRHPGPADTPIPQERHVVGPGPRPGAIDRAVGSPLVVAAADPASIGLMAPARERRHGGAPGGPPDAVAPPPPHAVAEPDSTPHAPPGRPGDTRDATAAAAADRPAVRVHVEAQGSLAHVWLGIDAQASPGLGEAMAAVARWLCREGFEGARWTCNGREIEADRTVRGRLAPTPTPPRGAGPAAADPFPQGDPP